MSHQPKDADLADLEQQAATLRRTLARPSEKEMAEAELARVEAQLAERRDAASRTAAEARCVDISAAVQSVVAALESEEQLVVEAAQAYAAAVERVNSHYREYEQLTAERAALGDRFAGLTGAKLPTATPPDQRDACSAAARMVREVSFERLRRPWPKTELCEHVMRERRTYGEVAGSPGHAIILQAGLKLWPELTARQREILAERDRDTAEARRAAAQFAAEAAIVRATPPTLPAGGTVQRG